VLFINKNFLYWYIEIKMASKATPIDHLPNSSSQGNVQMQMQMAPEQQARASMPPLPQHPIPSMPDGHQMYQQMSMDQEGQRENVQNNYVNRQFVQPPANMGGCPPDSHGQPGPYSNQPQMPMRGQPPTVHEDVDTSEVGIFQLLMMQSKTLAIVFALLVAIQLETSQGLFRKVTRMMKVPDTMVFTVSKVLLALIGVVIFFFVCRNL